MSKIQEALRRIRKDGLGSQTSGARPTTATKRGASPEKEDTVDIPVVLEEQVAGAASADTVHLVKALDQKIDTDLFADISVESLREQGLLAPFDESRSVEDEFRRIKRPLLKNAFGPESKLVDNGNVIMIGSALPGSGKSFCSVNLAYSIALERDRGVILVDADVLKPHISRTVGLEGRLGLIDFLANSAVRIEDVMYKTDFNNVLLIPAGTRNPEATELLSSRRMRVLVATLARQFPDKAIIFDTPPLLVTSEAQVLAGHMGQIVLVVEAGVTPRGALAQVLETLDRGKPINAILNKSRHSQSGSHYGGDYAYYGYEK